MADVTESPKTPRNRGRGVIVFLISTFVIGVVAMIGSGIYRVATRPHVRGVVNAVPGNFGVPLPDAGHD